MSLHDYEVSQVIVSKGYPFYALIMAAMRQADSDNYTELQQAFPEIGQELQLRYDAPGGLLAHERLDEQESA